MIGLVHFRVFVDGALVDDAPVSIGVGTRDLIGVLAGLHGGLVDEAVRQGLTWMIEVAFPDGDHFRWGTDPNGMVEPIETRLDELTDKLLRAHGLGE